MIESGEGIDDECTSIDIFIEPPDCSEHTDEDSADEDGTVNNFSRNQLRAHCSVQMKSFYGGKKSLFDGDTSDDETEYLPGPSASPSHLSAASCSDFTSASSSDSDSDSSSTPHKEQPPAKRKRFNPTIRKFEKKDMPEEREKTITFENKGSWILDKDYTPLTLFELFFDDEVVEYITKQTNLYATQQGKVTHVYGFEIKIVMAIIFVSGYVPLPRRRMFWENAEDCRNELVASGLTVNRFEEILSVLHFVDNTKLDKTDKMAKVRPLLTLLNERFLLYWEPSQNVNVDESMVPYYGRHSAKQFIRGKPIRYGFKMWCLNTPDGYLIQTEPYQGQGTVKIQPELGVGGSVVMDLLAELPPNGYHVFLDNFFTSIPLLEELKLNGMLGTGTVRANRTLKCPLITPDAIKKQIRGKLDYRLETTSGTIIIRWNDNSCVTVASTASGVAPTKKARRWSAKQKEYIHIDMPQAITQYNACMGGTDRMDQNLGYYRPTMRIRKWFWPIVIFCLQTSMHNAWQLYRKSAAPMQLDQLGFIRQVACAMIVKYRTRQPVPTAGLSGRPKKDESRWPSDVRYDNTGHFIVPAPRQRRCSLCKKNTTKMCSKCPMCPLHEKCAIEFHTK